jgi:uncharacterized protein YkwD
VASAALAAAQPAMGAQPCSGEGAAAALCVLNAERAAAGLAPLRLDQRLVRAARDHALEAAQAAGGSATVVPAAGLGNATVLRAGRPPRELALGSQSPEPGAACANGAVEPAPATLDAMREATLCLLNRERAGHGLTPLTPDADLAAAATAYAGDLVAGSYFSHTGRDGSSLSERIGRSGYLPAGAGWALGENLAWGTGPLATPASIVQAWMASPGHRHTILNPDYREIGIGIAAGNPAARDGTGATYATDFGAVDGLSRSARQLQRRVGRTGWLKRRPQWLIGEALAWGHGPLATPSGIAAAWLRSAPHRRVALRPEFRRVGIALQAGTPFGDGATLVADFGASQPALKRRGAGAAAASAGRARPTTRTSSSAGG